MIKTGNTIVFVSLAMIFLLSVCEEEVRKHELQEIAGGLISHSDCKSYKPEKTTAGEKDFTSVTYSFQPTDNKLKLNHINAGFNCCPGEISCDISFQNDTINIIEKELEHSCKCDCLFDLEIEIEGIEAKTYHLNFVEPYVGDQPKLQFIINLSDSINGSFTVSRDQYPWVD